MFLGNPHYTGSPLCLFVTLGLESVSELNMTLIYTLNSKSQHLLLRSSFKMWI